MKEQKLVPRPWWQQDWRGEGGPGRVPELQGTEGTSSPEDVPGSLGSVLSSSLLAHAQGQAKR